MKFLFILCAFFMTTTAAQAALQVIPPQQNEKPVISTLPALPLPTHSPVTSSYGKPSQAKILPAHGSVVVRESFSEDPFMEICTVKGKVRKMPSMEDEKISLSFRPNGKDSNGVFKGTSGTLKEVLAMQIPPGWVGYMTEDIATSPATGVFEDTLPWSETFRKFLKINQLQGHVHEVTECIYVQKLPVTASTSVTSALRDAEKSVSSHSSVTPLQESAYTALTKASIYNYSIHPGLLKVQLEEWCRAAGFELLWLSKNDFQLQGSQAFGNDFQTSIVNLFDLLYKEGRMSLKAQIFLGNKILRVRQD